MSDDRTPTPTQLADVIDVRPDERFDQAKLVDYLKGKLEGADLPLSVRQFGGGHANLTYLLSFGEGESGLEYVLRRPPLGPVAPGSHDMKREYRALSRLWKAFRVAPRAFLLCEDHEILGADFFVMERRGGIVVRREIPPEFGGGKDPVANRKLSEAVIDTLAELHQVAPAEVGLETLGKPDGFLERQVKGWTDRYHRAKTSDFPLAEELSAWLIDNMPSSPPATLLHNDWKLDNMAMAPDDPGRCVAVYDWDMCTVGDPLCDLGTAMGYWGDRAEGGSLEVVAMPIQSEGFMSSQEAMARYGDHTGADLAVMPYYVVFGIFKTAVVLQQIYFRFHQGQTQDERFAGMEAAARVLFEQSAARRP
jgi:aminoglycoside phosphotransferase (APT) family kinase protein